MLQARTLKILAALVALYVLLALPAYVGPAFLEEPGATLLLFTYLSLHFFHYLGVPGLLEHDGLCGWGWCGPTLFGAIFLAVFWLAVAWLIAWALARLAARLLPGR
jgi:hypothetical protein